MEPSAGAKTPRLRRPRKGGGFMSRARFQSVQALRPSQRQPPRAAPAKPLISRSFQAERQKAGDGHFDRFSSRQLLDQEQYEQKLDQILRRQTALESRASTLNGLGDMTGAIKLPARGAWTGEPRAIAPKPSHDKGAFVFPFATC